MKIRNEARIDCGVSARSMHSAYYCSHQRCVLLQAVLLHSYNVPLSNMSPAPAPILRELTYLILPFYEPLSGMNSIFSATSFYNHPP